MIEAFWIPLLPPYLIGLVLSFAVEALLTPRPVAPWRRPMAAVGVHVGVWTLAFALELMLFRRPYFAVANVLAIELLIVLVSNAKYKALKEPFVYPDFEYFLDAVKHPRLYLPFFGVGKAVAAGGGYGLALWAGLALEDSVTAGAGMWLVSFADLPQEHMFDPTAPTSLFFGHATVIALIGATATVQIGRHLRAELNADADLTHFGLFASLCAYRRLERESVAPVRELASFKATRAAIEDGPLNDIIVVQSESFFDARRAYPTVSEDVLSNFDVLRSESEQHGVLTVAAWGANTVRTEFSFLAGMNPEKLGIHRYNPYRKLAVKGFPTIASHLRCLGYKTICVHPYHKKFYGRDKVFPAIGFDEFVDIEHFKDAKLEGAYVADSEVCKKIIDILRESSNQPIYVHVITMENHGPLHWEKISQEEIEGLVTNPLPKSCEDLAIYLRHLRNADTMFGELRRALLHRDKEATLCIFGDHVPIMPTVYGKLGMTDGTTDYLIWRARRSTQGVSRPMRIEHLAHAMLNVAALRQ
ncbi:MAG: LTA synthase family protein [Achromobacter sp.]|uniref:LTA synthase family protein n=1 Tax=Achromobacter sp. TaxID=134375 RepID=UPI0029A709E8|nr:LTA synthase family protein [Achromobacter sp.]MDX3983785.1 LTA synthase family protein [Achromobacter sp.]